MTVFPAGVARVPAAAFRTAAAARTVAASLLCAAMILAGPFAARAQPSIPYCEAGYEYDSGFCFPACDPGYTGEGSTCWLDCNPPYYDAGHECLRDSDHYAKPSYGRGAGVPAGCGPNENLDASLCYPQCQSGYSGVGPVCWEVCDPGEVDDGAFCRQPEHIVAKASYGRGAGSPMVCPPGTQQDGALCYPWCAGGYYGVGPVCWQSCPGGYTDDGAFCRRDAHIFAKNSSGCPWYNLCCAGCPAGYWDDGCFCRRDAHIFAKASYGRGAGGPLDSCPGGSERDGALCYPHCAAGYNGVGPVCWENCAGGYIDDGAFCRRDAIITAKASYGRGAGTPVHSCDGGNELDGLLCYPQCQAGYNGVGPVCWENCPGSYIDDGAFCRIDADRLPRDWVDRDPAQVALCDAGSYTQPRTTPNSVDPFTMILAANTQLAWGSDPACTLSPGECERQFAEQTNRDYASAMNGATDLAFWPPSLPVRGGAAITEPEAVILNGDLTAFWHGWQVDMYRSFYDPAYHSPEPEVLTNWVLPGLGHQDYHDNRNACFGDHDGDVDLFGASACAAQAVRYMHGVVGCGTASNFPSKDIHSFDADSLAYSWDRNGWHFVQLQNHPAFTAPDIGVRDSFDWLAEDLRSATAAGLKIVLNMHDHFEGFSAREPRFLEALEGSNVVALFTGHRHERAGYSHILEGTHIPVFFSGSAEYSRFLLAEFGPGGFTVGVVGSNGGSPVFETAQPGDGLGYYPVDPAVPAVDPEGSALTDVRLSMARLGTPNRGRYTLKATAADVSIDHVHPLRHGFRIAIADATQELVDSWVYTGPFDGHRGWSSNGAQTRWTYRAPRGEPNGITRVLIQRGDQPNSVFVAVTARDARIPEAGSAPIDATVWLNPISPRSTTVQLGAGGVAGSFCAINPAGSKLFCQ